MANGTVGVAPGTTTLTLPNGQTVAISDWIDDKLYSTVQLINGQTSPVEAFTAGRSQPIPGGTRASTRVDTNVPRNGDSGLPQSWEMYVYGIGVKMVRVMRAPVGTSSPVLADGVGGSLSNPPLLNTLFQFDRVTYLEFTYNGKTYTYGVAQDYPQGNGFYVFATTSNFEYAQNGIPSPRDRNAMVLPIDLRENLGFKMSFQPEAPIAIVQAASDQGTDLTYADVKVYLYGLLKRSVV
jgi:hypothetical protein